MSQFKEAIVAYLGEYNCLLTDATREYLERLAEDRRTEAIAPHINTLVIIRNLAERIGRKLDARSSAVKHKVIKTFRASQDDWQWAAVFEEAAARLRGNIDSLICPETNGRLRAIRVLQATTNLSPGVKILWAGTKVQCVEVITPVRRQGNPEQKAFIALLSIAKKHTRWTDLDIASLTEIAFPEIKGDRAQFDADQVQNRRKRPPSRLVSCLIIASPPLASLPSSGNFVDMNLQLAQVEGLSHSWEPGAPCSPFSLSPLVPRGGWEILCGSPRQAGLAAVSAWAQGDRTAPLAWLDAPWSPNRIARACSESTGHSSPRRAFLLAPCHPAGAQPIAVHGPNAVPSRRPQAATEGRAISRSASATITAAASMHRIRPKSRAIRCSRSIALGNSAANRPATSSRRSTRSAITPGSRSGTDSGGCCMGQKPRPSQAPGQAPGPMPGMPAAATSTSSRPAQKMRGQALGCWQGRRIVAAPTAHHHCGLTAKIHDDLMEPQ
jgi:hypothetical protein